MSYDELQKKAEEEEAAEEEALRVSVINAVIIVTKLHVPFIPLPQFLLHYFIS
jgi:hypothetical protein